ncbi:MAG: lipid-A-disaccharide synthase [Pseudomonadota bacterium]
MNITLSAGESSGDHLGAALAMALGRLQPNSTLKGLVGPAMLQAGVEPLASMDQLNVMGLTEVVRHLPRLVRFRRELSDQILSGHSRLFVGIDAPDFNLGLARTLRRQGLPTAQLVSPSIWAWRSYRVRKIARSVDLLMTLFPFEAQYYQATDLTVRYIGHPLADDIQRVPDRAAARVALGLAMDRPIVALLPGSRTGELQRHAQLIIDTARALRQAQPDLTLCLLLADEQHARWFEPLQSSDHASLRIRTLMGQTRLGLAAADCAVAASGTVTLEALLSKTPMTIFYKVNRSTFWLARQLVRSPWVGLPNILANQLLVPERLQEDASAELLCRDTLHWLNDADASERFRVIADDIHASLACNAAEQAARILCDHFNLA